MDYEMWELLHEKQELEDHHYVEQRVLFARQDAEWDVFCRRHPSRKEQECPEAKALRLYHQKERNLLEQRYESRMEELTRRIEQAKKRSAGKGSRG